MIKDRSLADGGLLVRQTGHVTQITLNNPDRLNALRLAMWRALGDLAEDLAQGDTRAVILRGAGNRAFSAGADISEFGRVRSSLDDVTEYNRVVAHALDGIAALPMPVLAMIHGHCIGGGLEVALRCDLRLASDSARFAFTPAKLGLAIGADEVAALARIAGPSATAELLFTARPVSARRAEGWGLVNQVLPAEDLEAAATDIAQAIAQNAPLTLRAVKAGIAAFANPCDPQAAARADAMVQACYASDDYKEGQKAFAEKRPPDFRGA